MERRPAALTLLGGLQFAAFAVACVVLLGDGTQDGTLSGGDIALMVAVAIVGAFVVGSTWSGGQVGWWFDLLLGLATVVLGAVWASADDPPLPGVPLVVAGVLWVAILVLPQCRAWFLRPVQ